jgi:hypothetical protein
MLAAEMRAGEAELVAQEIRQRQPRFDEARMRLAVDRYPRRLLTHTRSARLNDIRHIHRRRRAAPHR